MLYSAPFYLMIGYNFSPLKKSLKIKHQHMNFQLETAFIWYRYWTEYLWDMKNRMIWFYTFVPICRSINICIYIILLYKCQPKYSIWFYIGLFWRCVLSTTKLYFAILNALVLKYCQWSQSPNSEKISCTIIDITTEFFFK